MFDRMRAQICELMIRSKLAHYEITSLLGKGGMGEVYRAKDIRLNRYVAIKFLSGDVTDAPARRRFQREAQMASSLNHPHIMTVYDIGEFEGRQYLVTEFIDGTSLDDWLRQANRSWQEIVELLIGIGDALATAHAAGILHRDVKPGNILITRTGYAKLVDFGIAKLQEQIRDDDITCNTEAATGAGMIIGTVAYMSPEQAAGKQLDTRTDVFSFAVTLYKALAGIHPFDASTTLGLIQAIIHTPVKPLPAFVPVELQTVFEKALQKDPADRPSMRDVVMDLRRILRQSDFPREIDHTPQSAREAVEQRIRFCTTPDGVHLAYA